MAQICQGTGRRTGVGNEVSHVARLVAQGTKL